MSNVTFPFLIFVVLIIGTAINPRNNLVLRILTINASVLFLVSRFSGGEINELSLLIYLAACVFVGIYYHRLLENERT